MNNAATTVTTAIAAALQSVAGLANRVRIVESEDELPELAKLAAYPLAAVLYEGMHTVDGKMDRSIPSVQVFVSVVVYSKVDAQLGNLATNGAYRTKCIQLLDDCRKAIAATPTPNGQKWHYTGELSPIRRNGLSIWIQRWYLPATLV